MTLTAAGDDSGRRLDRVLRKALPETPLSALYRFIRKGRILVNGKPAGAACRVNAGDVIICECSAGLEKTRTAQAHIHENSGTSIMPEILFEGAGLLILNKPPGLAVHGPDTDNLAARVRTYLKEKIPRSLSFMPGPLHRLDKPTSGIIVFSVHLEGAQNFSRLLHERQIRKTYLAILEGIITENAVWEDSLVRDKTRRKSRVPAYGSASETLRANAQKALTKVSPLAGSRQKNLTLAFLEAETGRTHQIRAQAAFHGHPLWRDRKYGAANGNKHERGFFLHAMFLELPRPVLHIRAEPPQAFSAAVNAFFPHADLRPLRRQAGTAATALQ